MCVSEFFESADLPCGKYTPDVYARYQDGTRMTLPQDEQHVSYYIHNGKHELDDEWKSDDTHHWKECKNVTDCPSINYSNDQKGDYGQHEYVLDGGTYKCNCGKELSVDLYIWNRATRYLRWNSINIADAYQVSIFDVNGNVEEQLIIDIDDCSDEIKNYFIDNVNGCEFEIELYFDDKQQSSGPCKLAVSVMKDGSIIAESETREYCIHEWGDEWVLFAGNSLHAQKCKYCAQTTNTGSHTYVSGRCICGLERKIDNFVVNSEGEASWPSYSGSYSYLLTIINGNGTTIITQNVTSPNCDIKALLEDNQKPSGTYTITVSALDSSENELTVPASATYNYTSATHYHEGEVDWRWNETHHWKSCELKSECTDKTPDAEHQYNAGRCECGKELTISNLTVDTDGIASWTPFDTADVYKVTITDGNGTPVYTETITETNYDVEELLTNNQNPTGTYTVTVSAIKDENEITIETSTDYDYTSPVPVHSHNWSSNWSIDDTNHWHKCTGANCTSIQDNAEHKYVEGFCACGKEIALKLDVNDDGVASWEAIVQAGTYIVTITDVDGNVIYSWDPGATSVDIEKLLAENGQSAGTYTITVIACDEEAELTKPVSEKYTYKLSENPVDSNNKNEIKEPVATDDLKDVNDLNAVDDLNGSNNTKTKKDRHIYRFSILWLIIILIIVAIVVYRKIKSSKK